MDDSAVGEIIIENVLCGSYIISIVPPLSAGYDVVESYGASLDHTYEDCYAFVIDDYHDDMVFINYRHVSQA